MRALRREPPVFCLCLLALAGGSLAGCRRARRRTAPQARTPTRKVRLVLRKGDRRIYRGRLRFSSQQDAFLTGGAKQYVFETTFRLTRHVIEASERRTCFRDSFGASQVRMGDVSPVTERRIASELDGLSVLWCLDAKGSLVRFQVERRGRLLGGLNFSGVLKRLYLLAAGATVRGKGAGRSWEKPFRSAARQGRSVLRFESVTKYAARGGAACGIADSAGTWRAAARKLLRIQGPTKASGRCLLVTGRARGIIPDFELSAAGRTFQAGGVVKGRIALLFDHLGWRAWLVEQVTGLVYSTKVQGREASFGLRTETTLELVRLGGK